MNALIENWVDKQPLVLSVVAVTSWIAAGMFWEKRYQLPLRIMHCFSITSFIMVISGAFIAFVVSLPVMPKGNIQHAITQDFIGVIIAFTEIGLETMTIWVPAIIVRVTVLILRDRRHQNWL